ncbi:MAG: hypothetical protein KDA70_17235, partial [Planctomycetaceae bacterium]|nr:hypothetical protein [Planctomycetaceae bacterium]
MRTPNGSNSAGRTGTRKTYWHNDLSYALVIFLHEVTKPKRNDQVIRLIQAANVTIFLNFRVEELGCFSC